MEKDTSIVINETTSSAEEMANALREIARLIDEGYTSGHNPLWVLNISE